MTSLLLKVMLAAVLTIASVVGLVAISGSIIFADINAPNPTAIAQDKISGGSKPMTLTGPIQ